MEQAQQPTGNIDLKSAIVIPARLESTRLPRKLLLSKTGKSLIEHTWIAASGSKLADQVVVATDSSEIFETVQGFGGQAVMTSPDHQSGSDRVAEATSVLDAEIIVNLQGDEPELGGEYLDRIIRRLLSDQTVDVATLATPIRSLEQYQDIACVKVVLDHQSRALYFSRSPIPAVRNQLLLTEYFESNKQMWTQDRPFLQHIGVYGFRRGCLEKLSSLNASSLEQIESLEQLRFLANGWSIGVEIVEHDGIGIDTQADYDVFVNRLRNG